MNPAVEYIERAFEIRARYQFNPAVFSVNEAQEITERYPYRLIYNASGAGTPGTWGMISLKQDHEGANASGRCGDCCRIPDSILIVIEESDSCAS